ncbi:P-loop containing nucleoside triphosphate hydrolase protein [Thamnocephalis sphaerospora]|uniref:P-loop containing nucleoside triphosphate hydrolase protein n=1 Tax=Thamnocephalis sphaerospora TaxID=78915 RepID=A0A4V1IWP0_9FUNG|nr:P-loop containing nucleoside triphosphate hydrolase protein [Thamnocephalis sphaerospora]|eukprot:RKP08229.1 P-loop containing nucleoside triphosphate hydrolase protein [Thamnocephalis sphaerospora]
MCRQAGATLKRLCSLIASSLARESAVRDLLLADALPLGQQTGLSVATLEATRSRIACSDGVGVPLQTAGELAAAADAQAHPQLPTGYASVDQLLGGGLLRGQVTELYGPAGAGKTQIAFNALAETLVRDAAATAVYLDTGGSFSARRVRDLVARKLASDDGDITARTHAALMRLRVVPCDDAFALMTCVDALYLAATGGEDDSQSTRSAPALIVVDSVSTAIASLLSNASRQGHLIMASLARALLDLAREATAAVLVLNGTVRDYEDATPAVGTGPAPDLITDPPPPSPLPLVAHRQRRAPSSLHAGTLNALASNLRRRHVSDRRALAERHWCFF